MAKAAPTWGSFPRDIQEAASTVENARSQNYQIQPLSKSMPDLDQATGFHISAAVRALREQKYGDVVAGRKIGFSNHSIWAEYEINASNCSYTYSSTTQDLTSLPKPTSTDSVEVNLSSFSALEPRIEPEIVLGIARPISASMTDLQLLDCIEWIAHGYEIVISIFPHWKFTAADTTAAFALHGMLLIGPKHAVGDISRGSPEVLLDQLATFEIELCQNGIKADDGKGSNVLGSPIKALRHLAELLEKYEVNAPLGAGEVVTTGTLTRALPINHDDVWSTSLAGIDLPGLQVKFVLR